MTSHLQINTIIHYQLMHNVLFNHLHLKTTNKLKM